MTQPIRPAKINPDLVDKVLMALEIQGSDGGNLTQLVELTDVRATPTATKEAVLDLVLTHLLSTHEIHSIGNRYFFGQNHPAKSSPVVTEEPIVPSSQPDSAPPVLPPSPDPADPQQALDRVHAFLVSRGNQGATGKEVGQATELQDLIKFGKNPGQTFGYRLATLSKQNRAYLRGTHWYAIGFGPRKNASVAPPETIVSAVITVTETPDVIETQVAPDQPIELELDPTITSLDLFISAGGKTFKVTLTKAQRVFIGSVPEEAWIRTLLFRKVTRVCLG